MKYWVLDWGLFHPTPQIKTFPGYLQFNGAWRFNVPNKDIKSLESVIINASAHLSWNWKVKILTEFWSLVWVYEKHFPPLCPSLMLRTRPFYCPSLSDSLLRFTAGIAIQQPISTLRNSQYDNYQMESSQKKSFSNTDQTRQRCVTLELSNSKKSRHRHGQHKLYLLFNAICKSLFNVWCYSSVVLLMNKNFKTFVCNCILQ